jgi:chromosomal replication initiation ATPase DnaA
MSVHTDTAAALLRAAQPDWREEVRRIAHAFGTTEADVYSPSRRRSLAHARWEIWAMLRARGWTLPRIGAAFQRDHTTVMYGIAERERRIAAREWRGGEG